MLGGLCSKTGQEKTILKDSKAHRSHQDHSSFLHPPKWDVSGLRWLREKSLSEIRQIRGAVSPSSVP